jgi:hypothetical protein
MFWETPGDRPYWGIFEAFFPEYQVSCPKPGTGDILGRKTGLFIPNWMTDRFLDDLQSSGSEIREITASSLLPSLSEKSPGRE